MNIEFTGKGSVGEADQYWFEVTAHGGTYVYAVAEDGADRTVINEYGGEIANRDLRARLLSALEVTDGMRSTRPTERSN